MANPQEHDDLYEILPATTSDCPAISAIMAVAFADDILGRNMDGEITEEGKEIALRNGEEWHRAMMENSDVTAAKYWKGVERKTGQTVAFAMWDVPITLTAEQEQKKKALDEKIASVPPPPGTNAELTKFFFGMLAKRRLVNSDPSKDFYMHILAVHPDHHRQQLGTRLLHTGLAEVDKAGARAYIEASAAGLPLYKKFGWKVVDEFEVVFKDFGVKGRDEDEVWRHPCLMRGVKGSA